MSSVNFTDSPVDGATFTNGNSTFIYKGGSASGAAYIFAAG